MNVFFRAASLDVEPVYTFRAHVGPVLCLAVSATGEQCFSGGMDSSIRCWNIPSSNIDPYDSFGRLDCKTSSLLSHEPVEFSGRIGSYTLIFVRSD